MNYKETNTAILDGRDIDEKLVKKDKSFYKYLFNNKVAYYYSKYLSKNQTKKERWIIRRGDKLNEKYHKTLNLLNEVCNKNDIEFLLYKTHKYIPEVVDGDVDILIKGKDFQKFLKIFEMKGFECIEDEPGKGKCTKENYCVIEPHINISWRGNEYGNTSDIWERADLVQQDTSNVHLVSANDESTIKLMTVLYEPEYLSLYDIKHIMEFSPIRLCKLPKSLQKMYYSINEGLFDKKTPLFIGSFDFIVDWTKEFFIQKNTRTFLLHIIFYFYWKWRYFLINKLPFVHDWKD